LVKRLDAEKIDHVFCDTLAGQLLICRQTLKHLGTIAGRIELEIGTSSTVFES